MAERALEQIVDDKVDGKVFAERFGHMLENTFSFNPTPQLFNPMVNVYANKDRFTEMTIESQGMRRLSPSRRTRAGTTELAKNVSIGLENTFGKFLGKDSMAVMSPVQIDYLIQSYLGGIGAMINVMANDAITTGKRPEKRLFDYQPFKRFMKEAGTGQSRYVQDVYDQMHKANMVYADLRDMARYNEELKVQELIDKERKLLLSRKKLNKAGRIFTAFNQHIKFIRSSDMPSKMKRKLIDDIKKDKERISKLAINN